MQIEITLPTLHTGQIEIYNNRTKRDVLQCGRRFGKTQDMITRACTDALKGKQAGIFTPQYRQLLEPFDQIADCLQGVVITKSLHRGEIKLKTGGKIDFWTLVDNQLAGRGRSYDAVYIDEAAFTKNGQMRDIWQKSIEPTLVTTDGKVIVYSTPNGIDEDNFFYQCCHDKELGFKVHHAPTAANPYVKAEYLDKKKLTTHPMVFKQEYLAEFVDWSGVAFFAESYLLANGIAVAIPSHCDYVFATIDTGMKDGSENDGTAVVYWAANKFTGYPLVILDWDIVQINSDLLTVWLPTVFANLEQFAEVCKARHGNAGAWIEDKSSGITLNQTAERLGWPAHRIEGTITSIGKDGRALSSSGAVYRGEVKISTNAYTKTKEYKGQARNHFLSQVCGYRLGDKDAAKRADDLYDCFTYGVIVALGGPEGF